MIGAGYQKVMNLGCIWGQAGLGGLSNAAKHAAGGFSHIIDAIFSIF